MPFRTLLLVAAAACGGPAGPQPTARLRPLGPPSIGDLLERRDSLGLTPDQRDRLVRLNLQLYRINRPLEQRLDSVMGEMTNGFGTGARRTPPRGRVDTTLVPWVGQPAPVGPIDTLGVPDAPPDTTRMPAAMRPLVWQISANRRAYLDSALALLSEQQRQTAYRLWREDRRMPADGRGDGRRPGR